MQHLCSLPELKSHLRAFGTFNPVVRFSRCIELIHIIHRLCGSPSIPLGFATVLPGRSNFTR